MSNISWFAGGLITGIGLGVFFHPVGLVLVLLLAVVAWQFLGRRLWNVESRG